MKRFNLYYPKKYSRCNYCCSTLIKIKNSSPPIYNDPDTNKKHECIGRRYRPNRKSASNLPDRNKCLDLSRRES